MGKAVGISKFRGEFNLPAGLTYSNRPQWIINNLGRAHIRSQKRPSDAARMHNNSAAAADGSREEKKCKYLCARARIYADFYRSGRQ